MALVPRGRNATALAEANAYDFDARISFVEDSHRYYIDGVPFSGPSVTKIKDDAFGGDDFDADVIIAKNLAGWKQKAEKGVDAKYPNLIRGLDDEAAIAAIKRSWKEANEFGTLLHTQAELYLNDVPVVGDDRVKKGGDKNSYAIDARSASRLPHSPNGKYNGLGLRVVRTVP